MNDQERRRGLFTLGRSMSAADLSILHAALGWMTEAGRLDAAPGTKLFEIRSAAKEFIAQFLADL
jgi:hypothetical protein